MGMPDEGVSNLVIEWVIQRVGKIKKGWVKNGQRKKKKKYMAFNTFWENWFRRTSIGTLGSSISKARKRHSLQGGCLGSTEATFRRICDFISVFILLVFTIGCFLVLEIFLYLDLPYSAMID